LLFDTTIIISVCLTLEKKQDMYLLTLNI